jgi:energy-coupling factor transporter ATP-binding protein EcfA2
MGEVTIPIEERIRINHLNYTLPTKLRELLDGFKWAIHNKKQSAVVIVDGRSGMGKTTISFQIAKYMTPDFSLYNVHFTPESFLDALTKTKKGDTIVFDEAMLLSSRSALSQINRMIIIAMSMIRSKNLLIIFNVNSIFDLDRNLALSRADLLLNCYGDSLTDKGKFLAFFRGSDGIDRIKELYIHGKKYYSYNYPKANFFTTFSSEFVLNEEEYERKKQEGVNKFLKGSKSALNNRYHEQRNRLIEWIYNNCDLTQEKIGEIAGINKRTVLRALKVDDEDGDSQVLD